MGQIRHERIVSDPEIMMGKPTIKGTRITVELVLEKLGHGMTMDEMLQAYPHLTKEQVLAALQFAAGHLPRPTRKFPPVADKSPENLQIRGICPLPV
jgi:uncharacterized protein (DUF433 family)